MIGQLVKHGRSARDAKNLAAHLMKDPAAEFEVINSAAEDLSSAMADMQLMRDASKADAAFLHLSLSPSRDMTNDELRRVAEISMKHMGAEDHQAVLVFHEKDRANNKGNRHAHLVLGRVSPDGKVLDSSFDIPRFETAMRLAEHELGEQPTLGRHHKFAVAWMQENKREDVAQWLSSAHPDHEKPQSSASPAKRQMIERTVGTDMTTVITTVRSAWGRSDDAKAFSAALAESGFDVAPGKKSGVYIISKEGAELGALDRLLKEKRSVVAQRMEGFNNDRAEENNPRRSDISRSSIKPERSPEPSTIIEAPGAAGTVERWPDRAVTTELGSDIVGPETSIDDAGNSAKRSSRFEENQTIIALDQMQLASSTVLASQDLMTHKLPVNLHQMQDATRQIEQHKTGWKWVQEFRNDLLEKIREIRDRIFGPDKNDVMDFSITEDQDTHNDYHYDAHDDDGEEYQPMRFG